MDSLDEPTLPPLPPATNTRLRPKRPALNTRKRTHSTLRSSSLPPSAASSDPALFSGDDEAAIENYLPENKRKKKLYSGSWWSHRVKAGKEERKKEFKRNVDSGIFMADENEDVDFPSSDSLGSLESELIKDLHNKDTALQQRMPQNHDRRLKWRRSLQNLADSHQTREMSVPMLHEEVKKIIRQHLDEGNETIYLSQMGLTDLPPEVAELVTLTKVPNLVPGMLDIGRSFEADLKLMLCNNQLRAFPLPVLNLSNLKILSLRQNKLRKLPGGIRHLTNLTELSVGGNKLNYLPFEVLELAHFHKLRILNTRPNPFEVTQSNSSVVHNSPLSTAVASTRRPVRISPGDTPSLTETVLRQLHRVAPRDDLKSFMPDETAESVLKSLSDLEMAREEGGRLCSFCKRLIVTPADAWLEFWAINSLDVLAPGGGIRSHDLVPFMRMICSPACTGDSNAWAQASTAQAITAQIGLDEQNV